MASEERPNVLRRVATIVVLSGLLAVTPALVVGMMSIDQPRFRSAVEERICPPGEVIVFRSRLSGSGSQRTTHCRVAGGALGEADVSLAMLATATRLVWLPLTGGIVLFWCGSIVVRRAAPGDRAVREAPRDGSTA